MYDGLLRIDTGGHIPRVSSCSLVAFADDVVVVVATGHTAEILQEVTNRALTLVVDWLQDASLTIAIQKTEAVVLTIKRGYAMP